MAHSHKENAGFVMLPEEDMQASGKRAQAAWQKSADAMTRLGKLVTECLARADQMRMEVTPSIEVQAELESMVAGIRAEYESTPRTVPLYGNYLGTIPGVIVVDVTDMYEGQQV